MKKFLIILLVLLGIGACTAAIGEEEAEAPVVQEEETVVDKEEPKEEEPVVEEEEPKEEPAPPKEESKEEPVDNSVMEQVYLDTMKENFSGMADVTFSKENKAYLITPTDPAFSIELVQMLQGTKSLDDWNYLVENTVYVSETIAYGIDFGYSVIIVNPENTDNLLLMVTDGVVVYDAFNE